MKSEAREYYKRCDHERYQTFTGILNSFLGSADDSHDDHCHHEHSHCDEQDHIERLDSRGKKMSLTKIKIKPAIRFQDPQTRHVFYSFATINLSEDTYLPTSQLKERANSMAYGVYKLNKRELAKHKLKRNMCRLKGYLYSIIFYVKLKRRW